MFGKCRNHQGLSAIMRRIGGCLLLSNSVSVRLWSLCRIISVYHELRHLCRGKLILLRWEDFLDQIDECLQVSGDSPRNWHLYSIVTCSFHNNLMLLCFTNLVRTEFGRVVLRYVKHRLGCPSQTLYYSQTPDLTLLASQTHLHLNLLSLFSLSCQGVSE